MPALPDVPAVIRIGFSGTLEGTTAPWFSRLFYHYGGTAPTVSDLDTLETAIVTAWNSHIKPLYHDLNFLTKVELVDLTSPTSATYEHAESIAGSLTGSPNPPAVAHVISYLISRRYRGGHPRGYWPFGEYEKISADTGKWDATWNATVLGDFGAFITALSGAGWSGAGSFLPCNVSYYEGFTNYTNPISGKAYNRPKLRTTPVIDLVGSYDARQRLGTQRRREAFVD